MTPDWAAFDRKHVWHPYTSLQDPLPTYPVVRAEGSRLILQDGRELIDGMSSWWCAIHGYSHPALVGAVVNQAKQMSHVMFGGISHEPAARLCERLVGCTADSLQYVFLADSGSVSVEVAMKMALQYWISVGESQRTHFLTPRGGYHGDPLACMSVSDPENGMHHLFSAILPKQIFVERPAIAFGESWDDSALDQMRDAIAYRGDEIAAVILEPIVQGAGGMYFYHPEYLRGVRALCDEAGLLLIFDEIATGFGRTGKMFAYEHADVVPDILCVGKALTGGMMTLAATMTNDRVKDGISNGVFPAFMHGPTFMGNPLACAAANASVTLLESGEWKTQVSTLEAWLREELAELAEHRHVADVRVLGAIGVVELKELIDVAAFQKQFVEAGVWIRPFGKLLYLMPPYILSRSELRQLTDAMKSAICSL